MVRITLFFFFLFMFGVCAKAQKKDLTAIGEIKGVVRDSLHNYSLASATIAVYSQADSALIGYQMANKLGEFSAKNLPIGKALYADFTFMGYKSIRKHFVIRAETNLLDFKNINLSDLDITLNEVQIKPPPVRMNKDTLEFYADAYTLEKSATVEDLVRKLDGLTVWGDGSITFKGKPINNLTVNGKQFFGGDIRVATQNLPKDIVQKIQVYNSANKESSLDSTINMNIKLKKGMDKGLFGKIGGGIGTKDRYGADASLKYFNNKLQFALLGASNNTNKTAGSVSALQQYSSFKGEGTGTEYSSDFSRVGLNKQSAGGVQFQYDLSKANKNIQEHSLLAADYFISRNFNNTQRNNQTDRAIPQSDDTRKLDINSIATTNVSQDLNLKYNSNSSKSNLALTSSVKQSKVDNRSSSNERITSLYGVDQSSNIGQNSLRRTYSNYSTNGSYSLYSSNASGIHKIMPTFDLSFNLSTEESKNDETRRTQFTSVNDPAQNKKFDRRYVTNNINNNHMLQFKSMPLQYLIFGMKYGRKMPVVKLVNTFNLHQSTIEAIVNDFNPINNALTKNNYLTNSSNYKVSDNMVGLAFQKSYDIGSLDGRYRKNLNLSVDLQNQFLNQQNRSDKSFQNLKRNYNTFLPQASASYQNYQNGSHTNTLALNIYSSIDIPEIYQIAPLVDSTDVFNLYQGNINLRETYRNRLTLRFDHAPSGIKKGLTYNLSADYNNIRNYIAQDIVYDAQGRRIISYQNAKGYQSFNLSSNTTKTVKFTNHQFQFRGKGEYTFTKRPAFINGINSLTQSNNVYALLNVGYSYKDKVFL